MKIFPRYILLALFSAAMFVSAGACKSSQNAEKAQVQAQEPNPSQDPAAENVAPCLGCIGAECKLRCGHLSAERFGKELGPGAKRKRFGPISAGPVR